MAWDDWLIGGGSDYSTGDTGSVSDAGASSGYDYGYSGENYGLEGRAYAPTNAASNYGDTSQMSYAPQQGGAFWDTIFSQQAPEMSYAPQVPQTGFTPGAGPSASLGNQWAGISPSTTTATSSAPAFGDYLSQAATTAEGVLGGLERWGQKNPRLASALTQGVGLLANASAQRRANDLMKQQLAMQQRQNEQQQQVFAKNTGIADMRNQLAQQQVNQALSLYNPQELGQRGMAQQQAATGRQLQQIEQQMASRGYSPADIAAAKRRAQVGGALNVTQGYMQGYDTGRSAQQGALSSAVGLGQQYGAAPTPADMSQAAGALSKYKTDQYAGLLNLANTAMGNPIAQTSANNTLGVDAALRKRLGLPT